MNKVGTGGSLLWGAQGQLLSAWAWRFGGHISTNNAAELEALKGAVEQLASMKLSKAQLGSGVLILGDSELVVGFCNRRYKPSKKFFNTVVEIRQCVRAFPVPVKFRHVFRE